MYGRKVGSSLLRLPLSTRLPIRPRPFPCSPDTSLRAVLTLSQRAHYATPGRPRKTVGEPSATVKRAAKRTSKATNDTATKQVAARKKTAAAKKTAKPKSKVKAKPKKPAKRELTEKQKAAKEIRLAKAKKADLKAAALKPPPKHKLSTYQYFIKNKMTNQTGRASDLLKAVAAEFKTLSPAEREHYNHLAHTESEANLAAYKKWVESHTPDQIATANRARHALRQKRGDKTKGGKKYPAIDDDRQVKRPMSQFILFSTSRNASGDFKDISIPERARLIGQEWKALNASEKSKYADLQKQDINRYTEEYSSVYGHSPTFIARGNGRQAQTATASA